MHIIFTYNFLKGSNGYKFGFNGHEKISEIYGEGNWLNFDDYGYDSRLGRRPSPDPEWKKGPDISPYSVFFNNPILFQDENGRWPIFVHYYLTRKALIEVGYSKQVASEIAHFASVYADNPNPKGTLTGVIILMYNVENGKTSGIPETELLYKTQYDYSKTKESQSDELIASVSIHAMKAWWEDISDEDAINRALYGGKFYNRETRKYEQIEGAYNVIERLKGVPEDKLTLEDKKALGIAFHTIQDVSAHKGKRWVDEHQERANKEGKFDGHDTFNDMFGDTTEAEKATNNAATMLLSKEKRTPFYKKQTKTKK